MPAHLLFPKLQTVAFSNALIKLGHEATHTVEDTVIYDLTHTEFVTPFGIVLLAGCIRECQSRGRNAKYIAPKKADTRNFLSGIGFNNFFKLQATSHKIESPNVQLRQLNSIDYLLTGQIVDVFHYHLTMTSGVSDSLKLALNELMTNVFDHSHSQRGCYVCAQSYPQARSVRLCIADFGIGIMAALRKNPKYANLKDEHESIKLAVKVGVTSRALGAAGLGLSHIQRFIKVNNGKMHILSGHGKIGWDYGDSARIKHQTMNLPFQGTIIDLFINIDKEGLYFLESERDSIF